MQILINNSQTKEAYILNVFTLNVMNSLTFVTIANTNKFYSLLLKLVKEGIISSFEPIKDTIKVSIRTKYIESIDLYYLRTIIYKDSCSHLFELADESWKIKTKQNYLF